jgi:hypothetical protein
MASFDVTTNNVIRLILRGQNPTGNAMYNVFHYRVTHVNGAPAGLENDALSLAAGFWNALFDHWKLVMGTLASLTEIQIDALDSFWTIVNNTVWTPPAGSYVGTVAGDMAPPFVCYTFKYIRPNATFRLGYKRFGGLSEGVMGGYGQPTPATRLLLDDISTALNSDITALDPVTYAAFADGAVMEPILYRRIANGDVIDEPLVGRVSNVVYSHIGSQNTRKTGRGI